jgi:beta-N-acetylhexosaminidase
MRSIKLFVKLSIVALLGVGVNKASAQKQTFIQSLNQQNHWVDSVFNRLNKKQSSAALYSSRVAR